MKILKAGDKVPDFSCYDQDGKLVSLSDLKGKPFIIFFYPRANTPGCINEVCNLRDHYAELKKMGYELIGVSADTTKKQSNFVSKFKLPFRLLADTEKEIIEAFGVWGPKKFMGKEFDGIHRTTFVVNASGIITYVIEKVKTKEHAAQLLEIL